MTTSAGGRHFHRRSKETVRRTALSRTVNGVEVVRDEPTEAPLRDKDRKPILWTQTRKLLLADGSTIYGCAHCDYVNHNPRSIRPHLRHCKKRPAAPSTATAAPTDLVGELVTSYEKLATDRQEWKERALSAEHQLRMVRIALGATT
ncbi:hypothetical protein [Saccharopolyspora taberi]|uniref:BED-type domain-containing protein n=1 Tax=Saccharopolyspora taberi TaxID=60895 RepID=A0ABN3VNU4_9PSEU